MAEPNVAQSVHQRLLNTRDATGESFNHLLIRYGLERLLYRLVSAGHGGRFVLKGAMLFALWRDVPGRPTRDVDLLGFGEPDHARLRRLFSEVCAAEVVDDGLAFDAGSVTTADIRDDQEYHGVRVRLLAYLGNARVPLQIDVGFGDSPTPAPTEIEYPTILGFPAPHIRAYHPATVVAEKLNAMVELGFMNSRLKDFYDLHVILQHMEIEADELVAAIRATFSRRNTPLPDALPVAFADEFILDPGKETQWRAFLRRSSLTSFDVPFEQVAGELREHLAPILQRLHN
jgi:predicted nucleotidyltransferase component of viral defense system